MYTGESGIQLGELVDDMVKFLLFFFQLCIQDILNVGIGLVIVHITAIAAIMRQFVGIPCINADVIHVIAHFAKGHGRHGRLGGLVGRLNEL
jgi:hypothetical protein